MALAALSGCQVRKAESRSKATAQTSKTASARPAAQTRLKKPVKSTDAQTDRLIREARKWIGTPYRYGGNTRSGTDCSGLVMELFLKVYDLKLPRSSAAQRDYCIGVGRKDLRPGDLVFFATTKRKDVVSHVGIYIGDGRMIHASGSRGVIESSLDEPYYSRTYHSGGRVLAPATSVADKAQKSVPVVEVARPLPKLTALDSLEMIIEQQIDSIYVSDPRIFD